MTSIILEKILDLDHSTPRNYTLEVRNPFRPVLKEPTRRRGRSFMLSTYVRVVQKTLVCDEAINLQAGVIYCGMGCDRAQRSFNIFLSAIFYIYMYTLYGGAAAATNDLGHDLRGTFLIFPLQPPLPRVRRKKTNKE